jgi:ubiquinone/menaquinone biosynthesis C-methylase UbiE
MNEQNVQKEQIAGLYNRVAAAYGRVGPNFFAYGGKRLVEHVTISEGARVLDVGAGRGANLFPAAEAVGPHGQVIGIDLASSMVQETAAEIERRQLVNVSMLEMDAEQLTFPNTSFDVVLCGFAIFLFPHLEQALSEFFRVLRPSGTVGITVARELDALSNWYGEHITSYHERYHFPLRAGGGEGRKLAELPRYLEQAGFVDVRVLQEQADFVFKDAQEWWDNRWTHGPRYSLEHMEPDVLAQFKKDVFARLAQEAASHGIYETMQFQYILASKGL